MKNEEIRQLRVFFDDLVNFPFLLKNMGVCDKEGAEQFVASYQEEEQVFEHFLTGLISQSEFYPINANKWLKMARLCNYNHSAIIDENIDLVDGGPISDWYIYARFIKWLDKNAPRHADLDLDEKDQAFLEYEIP